MRLIDADALRQEIFFNDYSPLKIDDNSNALGNEILRIIDNAPTVDFEKLGESLRCQIRAEYGSCDDCELSCPRNELIKLLDSERPTGHWINEHSIDIGCMTAECSCCGERSRLISHDTGFGHKYEYYPFCHWCGADMRKEAPDV